MAADLANYSFLPWMRQGLSSQIVEKDTYGVSDGVAVERSELLVKLKVAQTDTGENPLESTLEIAKKIKIIGPGDVIGVSDRAIVRTEPKPGVTNFEANSLVYIEFYEEDFLWRYTPASAGNTGHAAHRLRPWLALVVLADGEYTLVENKNGLASIKIEESFIETVLHSEKDTWAWGHVHLNHKIENEGHEARIAEVSQELDDEPDSGVSRLLCPRKLVKETRYQAFLIPAFETGRLAGLGVDPAGVKAQTPSWKKGNIHDGVPRPFEFPVYHRFSFNTGRYGDFESLVAMLKPVIIKPELGKRPMDIQSPGFGLNGVAKSKLLGIEGALKPPGFIPDAWPNTPANAQGNDQQFIDKLRDVVNLSHDLQDKLVNTDAMTSPFFSANIGLDPVVTPPLYGQWHALVNRVAANGGKKWVRTLNLDPRNRAAAGLGTTSIQDNQEQLMHEAWMQIGEVKAANQKIREAQLAKQVNKKVFNKHLARGKKDFVINKTALMHNQLKIEGKTVQQSILQSKIPLAVNSAAFKRLIRPGKKMNKKLNEQGSVKIQDQVITHFNTNLTAAKEKEAPIAAVAMAVAQSTLSTVVTTYTEDPKNVAKEVFFDILQPTAGQTSVPGNAALKSKANAAKFNGAALLGEAKTEVNKLIDAIISRSLTSGKVKVVLKTNVFEDFFGKAKDKYLQNVVIENQSGNAEAQSAPTLTLLNLQGLQTQFTQFQGLTDFSNFQPLMIKPAIASLTDLSLSLKTKLNPEITLNKRILHNIKQWSPELQQMVAVQFLKPIMAYPKFEKPVFEYVKKISQDYIMPNIDKVGKNSITIVQTNQKFIEAFMVGLNHEMSRELLWREYPTDQRGTYFRQFWDTKDNIDESDPEQKLDIKEMHTWSKDLGQHQNRKPATGASAGDDGYLVLLIRGDVFKKYPNTMVYAQKAIYNPADKQGPRILPQDLDKDVMYPLFQAELEPDVYLFGFDLSIELARGHRGDTNPASVGGTLNPGYFFVLRERPGQIRFGLDDYTDDLGNTDVMPPAGTLESWNDLSWEHTVNNKGKLERYHLDFKKNLTTEATPAGEPNAIWNSNAADMAWILYQNPVIFARHAGEMLPED